MNRLTAYGREMNRLTAYIIYSRDDIQIDAGGPTKEGKWAGWITLGPEDRYRPLLNSEPVYNSKEEAIAAMKAEVANLREMVRDGKI